MRFHDPQLLWLLALLIPWALLLRRRARAAPALVLADGVQIATLPDTWRARLRRRLPWLRLLVLALAVIALARPQTVEREISAHTEGVDLVIALDLSSSMLAEDLLGSDAARHEAGRNRLDMAKAVLDAFIRGRPGDRIGLVAFAARPYPAVPLTLDHAWLRDAVAGLRSGAIEDGTALGDALLTALNRLRGGASRRPAASQAVILLTDGRNNAGATSPRVAAAAARTLGIRVHAIGIGARGEAVIPVEDPLGGTVYRQVPADLDEAVLGEIANITGGGYFRADDAAGLAAVFREIDRLEKRRIEEKVHFAYGELFPALLLAMLALLAAELTLRAGLLRTLP